VCSEFNVSKADLISDAQNPKFYYPRIALSYLMYTHMNLTLKEVGHITNRSNSSVHRCIQDVKALDDKFTDQKEVKRKILKLDEELKKLKSKSK
jgi:chromosomal replication initiation ATPase DnaA